MIHPQRLSLGVHIGNDRGAALVSNGELIAQIAEERLDRRKHSSSPALPLKSIKAVLEIGHTHASELGVVGLSYTNVEIDRILPELAEELRDVLRIPVLEVIGVSHHDCHAWSTYCTSGFDAGLIVVADGSGDIINDRIEAESIYVARGSSLQLIDRRLQDFGSTRMSRRNSFSPSYMSNLDRRKSISLGRKYEQFTYLIGFEHGESGKTMGLAAYSDPLYEPQIPQIKDLSFSLTFETGLLEIEDAWQKSGIPWHRFVKARAPAIAASAQKLLEGYMEGILEAFNPRRAHEELCGAGGVFLNCQMNGRILRSTRFRRVHVVPAAGDDGQCIGAAFCAYATAFEAPRRASKGLPYLGPEYSHTAIEERLRYFKLPCLRLSEVALLDRLSADLAEGNIVGLVRGRSETGPRALCHRSLLADPRRDGMKDYLNRLKGRELFRPFAPVVTAEDQVRYFDLVEPSPYMLFASQLRAEFLDVLPAIVHVDGSARVQSVTEASEPFVHSLLRSFESLTSYPILLNTSFNIAGDPIVESPHDAIVTYLNSEIDVLAINDFYVNKGRSARSQLE